MTEANARLARYRRPLIFSVVAAVAVYLVGVFLADGSAVLHRVTRISVATTALALALPTAGFLVRFVRWDGYMRSMGHRIPPRRHLRIYLAGFALTTTPGKVGENLRLVFLDTHGVGAADGVAAFVAARLSDLVAMLLLSALAWRLLGDYGWLLGATVGITLAGLLIVRDPRVPALLRERFTGPTAMGRGARALAGSLQRSARLLSAGLLVVGVTTALLAWSAEALSFGILARATGIEIGLLPAMGIFAVATLLGAVSFVPGGVGPTEAVLAGLLVSVGAPLAAAAAATLLVRAFTLWWAVVLGLACLVLLGTPRTGVVSAGGEA